LFIEKNIILHLFNNIYRDQDKDMKQNILDFLDTEIWLLDERQYPVIKRILIKSLKIIVLSAQGFSRDQCLLRSSALTLYTLLSIVPVIAMLFGIAKGFGFEKILKQRLMEQIPHQDTVVLQLIGFAENMLANAQGGVIAGIGVILLFWSVIKVIGNIEESFNDIWKIKEGRGLSRKITDYLSLMLLAPVLFIASGSITVFLNTEVTWFMGVIELPEFGIWLVLKAFGLLPVVLMSGLFAFTFIFMPNHKIHYMPGIIAGIVTGVLYQFLQWAYLSLQLGVSGYNAIYGSFAALPLLVIWLQSVWMVILLGCQMAFFLQNYQSYRNKEQFSILSIFQMKVIALQITQMIIKNFVHFGKPLTRAQIAEKLLVPIGVVQPILSKLIAGHILAELKSEEEDEAYLPAVDIHIVTIAYVIEALEQCGQHELPEIAGHDIFMETLNHFRQLMEVSEQNRLLKDIEF